MRLVHAAVHTDCARLYMTKVSGPMLDRLDIMIDVAELPSSELLSPSVA